MARTSAGNRLDRELARLKPGDHLCAVYDREPEHRALLVAYLRQGLERGEKVVCLADPREAAALAGYLAESGFDAASCLARGQLAILPARDFYRRTGSFSPGRTLARLRRETDRATAEGYPALRVTAEMSWALDQADGADRLLAYEAALNTFFPGRQALGLCRYDRRRVPPETLLGALATHPVAVIGTEIFENIYCRPAITAPGPPAGRRLEQWLAGLRAVKAGEAHPARRLKPPEFRAARRGPAGNARRAAGGRRARKVLGETVMNHLPIGVAVHTSGPEAKFEYMNDCFPAVYRTSRAALTAPDGFWTAVYEDPVFRERFKARVEADIASGDPSRMRWEDVPVARDGKTTFISAASIPLPGRAAMISTAWDVTGQKLARERLLSANRLLEAMLKINEAILAGDNPSLEHMLAETCATLAEKCGYLLAWAGLIAADGTKIETVARAGPVDPGPAPLPFPPEPARENSSIIAAALAEMKPCMVIGPDLERLPVAWREILRARDCSGCLALPIAGGDARRAVLAVCLDRQTFGNEELMFLFELTQTIALAWAKAAESREKDNLARLLVRANRETMTSYLEEIERLTIAAEYRDEDTGTHLRRIGRYARLLARELGLSEREAEIIARAAPMHDLGKIAIPDHILLKPGNFTPEELSVMKRHTMIGAMILEGSPSEYLQAAEIIALTHHENWDGSGYPAGLKGEEIPLAGRIMRVADTYEALRSRRPYKEPVDHETACRIILEGDERSRPGHYDPRTLAAFRRAADGFAEIFKQNEA